MIKFLRFKKIFLTTSIFSLFSMASFAQNNNPTLSPKEKKRQERNEKIDKIIRQEEEGALVYSTQNIWGLKLYSDGWGFMYERGFMKTVNKTNLFGIEIGERKDHREYKYNTLQTGSGFITSNSFIYGKQNNFLFAKIGVGQSYLIGGKGNRNGVAVSAIYYGGASIGLLKPYYVNSIDPTTNQYGAIKYKGDSSANDNNFLDLNMIDGKAGFFKGFGELKVKPGLFAKGAVRFDYGRYNEFVSAIETGVNVEYYTSGMPILVNNDPKKFFLNVFVAIEFGNRK